MIDSFYISRRKFYEYCAVRMFRYRSRTSEFFQSLRVLKITQRQSAIRSRLLEEELGVKLFNRTSKNVALTQEGISFFADAQLILKTAISAKERLGRHERFIPF